MCFAQDDLLKWGAALFLRFLGQSICEANMDALSLQVLVKILSLVRGRPMVAPTDLNVVLKFVCSGGYYPHVLVSAKRSLLTRRRLLFINIFIKIIQARMRLYKADNIYPSGR